MGTESERSESQRPAGGGRSPGEEGRGEGGVAEALRGAVERTLSATAGPAASTRERAVSLLDDVARLGRDARDELARRSQEAGAGLTRRGQGRSAELIRRLGAVERRIEELEDLLRQRDEARGEVEEESEGGDNPELEG